MATEDILEALAARQALELTPQPWLDAARGAIPPAEAARRVEGQEDPALVERSKQLFAPGDRAVDEERLQQLLVAGFAPPSRSWGGAIAVLLAMAAALVLVLAMPWSGPSGVPMTRYVLELEYGAREHRAAEPPAPTDIVRFHADREMRATLRPSTAVAGKVAAAVHVCEGSGLRRLAVEPRVEPSGVVVVESEVAALGLGVGRWDLLFVVGTADPLPVPTTCTADELGDVGGVRLLRTRIEILPPSR